MVSETQLITAINDVLQELKKGHQIDVAMLDFRFSTTKQITT